MSDGMGREPAYLSSHATNRYFIPNWGNTLFIKGTVVPSGDGGDRPSAARQEVGTAEGRD